MSLDNLPKTLKNVQQAFFNIKALGFVSCTRQNNNDGGIGNTFEDLLGVEENNLKEPDFQGYEVKTQREITSACVTLFSKSPTYPRGANAKLKDSFGEVRDPKFPNINKLYASIFGDKWGTVYNKFSMKLEVDKTDEKVTLIVKDLNHKILSDEVYWSFDDLKNASMKKMTNIFIVSAKTQTNNNVKEYYYEKGTVYHGFLFDNFISGIENGSIQFDIRMGVYGSGKNMGKPHDHGSGFRMKKNEIYTLYQHNLNLE